MDYARVVDEIFSQIKGVRFAVRLWDGRKREYGSGRKRAFTLVFHSELAAKRLLSQGSLGFGECYMDGSLQVEGSLANYLELRHKFKKVKPSAYMTAAAVLAKRTIPKDTASQISYHYDLGNDFFKLLLDKKTMSYSCGLFESGKETLVQAQQNKLKLVCDWLDLPPGSKVLDLGCGWGGFATYAAAKRGWHITSCTLSKEQLRYCEKLVARKGLESQIKLKYIDMLRELPGGQFDAIVMLESIEHVGKKRLNGFIEKLYASVKPGGVVYIQTSGRYQPKSLDKWTLKYVFPGGHLPSQQELVDDATQAGFKLTSFVDDAPSYVKTIDAWTHNLADNKKQVEAMFDESTYRLWELWTLGAKVGFEVGSMGLFRIKLTRP